MGQCVGRMMRTAHDLVGNGSPTPASGEDKVAGSWEAWASRPWEAKLPSGIDAVQRTASAISLRRRQQKLQPPSCQDQADLLP
jgi:hypothetical protein